jgi:signal peptidase II
MLLLVTMPLLILDQASKHLISAHFALFHTVPIVPGWLDLTYTLNPGAAFSLFATMPASFRHLFFIGLSIAAIVVLTMLILRRSMSLASKIAFALILGGTVGNLIDRVRLGEVVDFIYFHHAWFHYPVFNLADSAISVGVVLILILSLFSETAPAHQPAAGHSASGPGSSLGVSSSAGCSRAADNADARE